MSQPRRIAAQAGRHALVDSIPFRMPVQGIKSSALMAARVAVALIGRS